MISGSHKNAIKKIRLNVVFGVLTFFISLPVIILIYLAVEGFRGQVGQEAPYDVLVTNITRSSATVTWFTEKKTQATIEYGTSQNALNSFVEEAGASKEHVVEINLLASQTTYYFQIKINDRVYNNDGVAYVFTTKTKDGKDVLTEVKGISTDVSKKATSTEPTVTPTVSSCDAVSCEDVKAKIGKGCQSSDYIECLTTNGASLASFSAPLSLITSTPIPSTVYIINSNCNLNFVQSGASCAEWIWDGVDTKPQYCRKAFNRYILQCRNVSFTQYTDKVPTWYYNGALTDYASTSAKLKVLPVNGDTVYCQVRAEDEVGGNSNATPWVRAERKCAGL